MTHYGLFVISRAAYFREKNNEICFVLVLNCSLSGAGYLVNVAARGGVDSTRILENSPGS